MPAPAEKADAKLVIFNANNDPTAQNNAIETYTAQKVNAIIVVAIDVNGVMPALQQASAVGIPVLAVDGSPLPEGGPQKTQVGVNNEGASKQIGEVFLKYVDQNLGGKAQVGIVGAPDSYIQNLRQKGFEETIKANDKIKVVGVVNGGNVQEHALAAALNLMLGNPAMNAIYATGEPALVGAAAAVEAAGVTDRVKIFGWDLTPQIIKAIDDGFVVAVVRPDPHEMGVAAVDAAMKLIGGGSVPPVIDVPVAIVTKENFDNFSKMFTPCPAKGNLCEDVCDTLEMCRCIGGRCT